MNDLKKILASILLLTAANVNSQDGWFWLNPLPQGNWYNDVAFTTNNTVYVSAAGNTLMKSIDGGNAFSVMTNKESNGALVFINDVTGFSAATDGLLKTTNGGNNWRYIPAPVDYVLGYSTSPQTVLYGLKNEKVYLSNNLGESWTLSLTAYPGNILYSVHFPSNSIGFAAGYKPTLFNYGRLHKTTNGGTSWDTIPANFRFRVKAIHFLNENTGFICTEQYRQLLMRTTNSGISWDTVSNLNSQYLKFEFLDNSTGYIQGLYDLLYTTNQGLNWTKQYTGKKTYLKNLNEGFGYSENFLYKTTNTGLNWSNYTQGFSDELLDVIFINQQTGFTAGDNRIYKSTNEGINWVVYELNMSLGFTNVENIMFVDQNTGYAGIDGGRIARTTNCGMNWQVIETGQYDHLHGMHFPSVDTGYAVTKYGYYLKTINGGNNWSVTGRDSCSYGDILFSNNTTGFSGGYNNNIDRGIIKRTTNGGLNWEVYYLDTMNSVFDVCNTSENFWFAAGFGRYNNNNGQDGFICRSMDFGNTWQTIQFPHPITSITFSSEHTGYACAYNNLVYKTTNSGDDWFATYNINAGGSDGLCFVDDLTGYGVGRYGQIIKTTSGGGVLINIEPQSYIVPVKYNLYQNYPNPFNPATKIKFDIPKAMNASLKIYDILGREVSVIVNDFLIPGTYAFDYDGSNLPSGVYFYVLHGEGFTESKKMILLK
jgi:photosystem II stability/assembly factor-like uncharacterized protein